MRRLYGSGLFEEAAKMTQRELDLARRKYNLSLRNVIYLDIEKMNTNTFSGNYMVVEGRLVPMEVCGEIMEERNESD